jgi:ribulose-phosphate 3-epimerase
MKNQTIKIAPSILSADFSDMKGGVELINKSGADWIHVDVMDGCFVPNLTFGPKMVKDIKPFSKLPLDVHLMVAQPDALLEEFASAGADYLTFHIEAIPHAHRTIQNITALGVKPGISLVPSTPVMLIQELLPIVSQVLVMTVNPGFGGQVMIESCLNKVKELVRIRDDNNLDFLISVDGGINTTTAPAVINAGADVLISGSSFFCSSDPSGFVGSLKALTVG